MTADHTPDRLGYIYVVGEIEVPDGPVKIGMTAARSNKGRAGLSEGNWRTLEELHSRTIAWATMRWFEWRVHEALAPWHRRGEWFDVRDLMKVQGGWDAFLDAAVGGGVPGAKSCAVEHDGHRLLSVERQMPDRPIRFVARCSCGAEIPGQDREAFITVLRAFETGHLGLRRSNRSGRNRRST